ncbi:unnamed protein product [Vitrella brassicaformis CCMP3155]|uniref:Phosphodiesterase n=3 Tax=Vitrella brassicaformis TaxID=1169539 RepID=A0A0G4ETV6_VITBC|nr:unnamed protein product [Vitrella brassicaformis CCMP3155]|eukprot:CEM01814.1 unnamed protein product [Vitrella brassicaformis CCMP3155]
MAGKSSAISSILHLAKGERRGVNTSILDGSGLRLGQERRNFNAYMVYESQMRRILLRLKVFLIGYSICVVAIALGCGIKVVLDSQVQRDATQAFERSYDHYYAASNLLSKGHATHFKLISTSPPEAPAEMAAFSLQLQRFKQLGSPAGEVRDYGQEGAADKLKKADPYRQQMITVGEEVLVIFTATSGVNDTFGDVRLSRQKLEEMVAAQTSYESIVSGVIADLKDELDERWETMVSLPIVMVSVLGALSVICALPLFGLSGYLSNLFNTAWTVAQRSDEELSRKLKNLYTVAHLVLTERLLSRLIVCAGATALIHSAFTCLTSREASPGPDGERGKDAKGKRKRVPTAKRRAVIGKLIRMLENNMRYLLRSVHSADEYLMAEADVMELHAEHLDLRSCVEECIEIFYNRAAAKGITLSCTFGPGVPSTIIADEGKLRQILIKLLSGAVENTNSGGVDVFVVVKTILPLDTSADITSRRPSALGGFGSIFGGFDLGRVLGLPVSLFTMPRAGQKKLLETGRLLNYVIQFEVKDTGEGLQDASDILDPMSLKHKAGEGLRLLVAGKMAQVMGGQMEILSIPSKGTITNFSISAQGRFQPSDFHPDLPTLLNFGKVPLLVTLGLTPSSKGYLTSLCQDLGLNCQHAACVNELLTISVKGYLCCVFIGDVVQYKEGQPADILDILQSHLQKHQQLNRLGTKDMTVGREASIPILRKQESMQLSQNTEFSRVILFSRESALIQAGGQRSSVIGASLSYPARAPSASSANLSPVATNGKAQAQLPLPPRAPSGDYVYRDPNMIPSPRESPMPMHIDTEVAAARVPSRTGSVRPSMATVFNPEEVVWTTEPLRTKEVIALIINGFKPEVWAEAAASPKKGGDKNHKIAPNNGLPTTFADITAGGQAMEVVGSPKSVSSSGRSPRSPTHGAKGVMAQVQRLSKVELLELEDETAARVFGSLLTHGYPRHLVPYLNLVIKSLNDTSWRASAGTINSVCCSQAKFVPFIPEEALHREAIEELEHYYSEKDKGGSRDLDDMSQYEDVDEDADEEAEESPASQTDPTEKDDTALQQQQHQEPPEEEQESIERDTRSRASFMLSRSRRQSRASFLGTEDDGTTTPRFTCTKYEGKMHAAPVQPEEVGVSPKLMARMNSPSVTKPARPSSAAVTSVLEMGGESLEEFLKWECDILSWPLEKTARTVRLLLTSFSEEGGLKTSRSTISSFVATMVHNYHHSNYYHNFWHGVSVAQVMAMFLTASDLRPIYNGVDKFALAIASLGHDTDHPGVSNRYLTSACSFVARLYNDASVLENHHSALLFEVLAREESDVFNALRDNSHAPLHSRVGSGDKGGSTVMVTWPMLRKRIVNAILATDMAKHFDIVKDLKEIKAAEMRGEEGRPTITGVSDVYQLYEMSLMHAADISNPTLPFYLYREWAVRIVAEFHAQNLLEAGEHLPVSMPMVKGITELDVANSQVGFIDFICLPLFSALTAIFPVGLTPRLALMEENRDRWKQIRDNLAATQKTFKHRTSTEHHQQPQPQPQLQQQQQSASPRQSKVHIPPPTAPEPSPSPPPQPAQEAPLTLPLNTPEQPSDAAAEDESETRHQEEPNEGHEPGGEGEREANGGEREDRGNGNGGEGEGTE